MAAARKTASKSRALQVTAPLVQVQVGKNVLQFSYGDILPEGISEESVKHLQDLGYVGDTEVDADESPADEN